MVVVWRLRLPIRVFSEREEAVGDFEQRRGGGGW